MKIVHLRVELAGHRFPRQGDRICQRVCQIFHRGLRELDHRARKHLGNTANRRADHEETAASRHQSYKEATKSGGRGE